MFYSATPADEARRGWSAEVLQLFVERTCHVCAGAVLTSARGYTATRAHYDRLGVRLEVVCHGCLGKAFEARGWPDELLVLELQDAELTKLLQRHAAERN
jgi:hypothetical protein